MQRVFKYATAWDFVAYGAGIIASIGAGVTLPLMNVVFGNFVGSFTDLATGSTDGFLDKLNQLSYVTAIQSQ